MEEKEHIIKALQTKVTLLKSQTESSESQSQDGSSANAPSAANSSENGDECGGDLIDLEAAADAGSNGTSSSSSSTKKDGGKVKEMEGEREDHDICSI